MADIQITTTTGQLRREHKDYLWPGGYEQGTVETN